MSEMSELLIQVLMDNIGKIILSDSRSIDTKKIEVQQVSNKYQVTIFRGTQVFHSSVDADNLSQYIEEQIDTYFFKQLNAWSDNYEYSIRITKRNKILFSSKSIKGIAPTSQLTHNREKNYIFKEGMIVPPLIDMGIFTTDGKIVSSMYGKYKQINRFIELIDDEVKDYTYNGLLNVIDFGCGKSYLTFLLYYYFVEIKKIPVRIIGMDLKKDVVSNCNSAAQKYGYTNLSFIHGDIKDFKENISIDFVITLHACDTATDYALFHAMQLDASVILSVPCCQHELNSQISKDNDMSFLLNYGLLKERFSALLTDALRANLLEANGYSTQIIEFIDMEHTPKNIMIRAHKANISKQKRQTRIHDVESVIHKYKIHPTLYSLLYSDSKK